MSDSTQITVTLGNHEVPVYPQPWPYLFNRVGRLQKLLAGSLEGMGDSGGLDLEAVIAAAGNRLYDVLVTAVPTVEKRVPRYEFNGFTSAEAMDAGEFDELAAMAAPTIPQIKAAFKVAAEVNGVDVVEHLARFAKALWGQLDPKTAGSLLTVIVSEGLARTASDSTTSASSPSTRDGLEASTSSGVAPTSTGSTLD